MNIKDIAKMANVSISSVSRVINKQPGVNPEARKRVEAIIKQTGYRPNLLARELITKKTKVIGIILPAVHNFYTERINAITEYCRKHNYSVMLANSMESSNREISNFHLLYEKQVDGIIFFSTGLNKDHIEVINSLKDHIPIIITDQEFPDQSVTCILHDNYSGSKSAVEHLINLGHKNIGFIKGPDYDKSAADRYNAYLKTMKENNLTISDDFIFQGDYKFDSGYKIGQEIAKAKPKISAIFAANDLMAIGLIKSLRENNYVIPDDFSVIGYDNIPASNYISPSLTTINQHQNDEGNTAAEYLINIIEGKNNTGNIVLPAELIIRESTQYVK